MPVGCPSNAEMGIAIAVCRIRHGEPNRARAVIRLAKAVHPLKLATTSPLRPPPSPGGWKWKCTGSEMKQKQFAQLLGISESRLSEVINGRRAPNLDLVKRLHTTLHVPGNKLLELV